MGPFFPTVLRQLAGRAALMEAKFNEISTRNVDAQIETMGGDYPSCRTPTIPGWQRVPG